MNRCLLGVMVAGATMAWPAIAQGAEPPSEAGGTGALHPRSKQQFTMLFGFSHWYGGTFGAPSPLTTPALTLGVRPKVRFLELRLHYTIAVRPLEIPEQDDRSRVGFGSFDLLFAHELRVGSQRLLLGFSLGAGIVHTKRGVGPSLVAGGTSRYMIDAGKLVSVGPFVDLLAQVYRLPGSDTPLIGFENGLPRAEHSDVQVQIGVAVSVW